MLIVPDRRNFIITDKALGMDKAWRILVNLNAGFQQDLVIGLRQNIGSSIRDARVTIRTSTRALPPRERSASRCPESDTE